jgi:Ca2+-binding EF-hand superfamily protein
VVKRSAPKYTKEALQRLEVARRLFKMFDTSGDGNLGKDEVRLLLIETYKQMGMSDFNPTTEDVDSFMELVDSNADGQITLEDYENYIIRSLKEAGIKIEEEGMKL